MLSMPVITNGSRQVQRIVQTLNRRNNLTLQDEGAPIDFIPALQSRPLPTGENLMLEAAKMRVHHVQGHLHGVETELWAAAMSSIRR